MAAAAALRLSACQQTPCSACEASIQRSSWKPLNLLVVGGAYEVVISAQSIVITAIRVKCVVLLSSFIIRSDSAIITVNAPPPRSGRSSSAPSASLSFFPIAEIYRATYRRENAFFLKYLNIPEAPERRRGGMHRVFFKRTRAHNATSGGTHNGGLEANALPPASQRSAPRGVTLTGVCVPVRVPAPRCRWRSGSPPSGSSSAVRVLRVTARETCEPLRFRGGSISASAIPSRRLR
ncbi:hypothetical protein EYF80_013491 [Liparis tanakae]|uniref:Uncharacterized protein n=1 Tax=Liparis tanakae TaxID=230148 RepID=A0A4Z2IGE1_9TELE|nr:hypothetical protein EYF80_013491 [Liparis tanakae]